MPINRVHAFATGVTYPIAPTSRLALARLRNFVLRGIAQWLAHLQAVAAVESFNRGSVVGTGCRVGPYAWCVNLGPRENVRIGNGVICRGILRCENRLEAHLIIGDNVYIGDDCIISCAERIEIGRLTLLAHGVQIFDNDSHPLDPISREQDYMTVTGQRSGPRPPIASAPIWIGERAWIGFNAIVTKGVCIGEGSVVAAGSVVISDVPPYTVVAGNPARVVKQLAPIDRPPLDEDENEV